MRVSSMYPRRFGALHLLHMLGPGWVMKPPDGLWKRDPVPREDYVHAPHGHSMPGHDFRDKCGVILWLLALRWE